MRPAQIAIAIPQRCCGCRKSISALNTEEFVACPHRPRRPASPSDAQVKIPSLRRIHIPYPKREAPSRRQYQSIKKSAWKVPTATQAAIGVRDPDVGKEVHSSLSLIQPDVSQQPVVLPCRNKPRPDHSQLPTIRLMPSQDVSSASASPDPGVLSWSRRRI